MKTATLLTGGLLALALTVGAESKAAPKPGVGLEEAVLPDLTVYFDHHVAPSNAIIKRNDMLSAWDVTIAETPRNAAAGLRSLSQSRS
jgi:hypothetical protein